jgi:hypothetical protein
VLVADDAFGGFGHLDRRLLVVGAVTYVVAQDALSCVVIAFGVGDCG